MWWRRTSTAACSRGPHNSRPEDVQDAIDAALDARHDWARMAWSDRAAVFLRAAELLAGPFRDR